MPLCCQEDKVRIRGSKSIINRLLILAIYHDSEISIKNINLCQDVMEMLNIYTVIGKQYSIKNNTLMIFKASSFPTQVNFYIKESGTCLRFVLPYFAFSNFKKVTITLGERLSQRPLKQFIKCLNNAGAEIKIDGNTITINGRNLVKQTFFIDSKESSQFLSSLLLFKNFHKNIIISGKTISESYIRMTNDVIHCFKCGTITLDPDYSTVCYLWFYSFLLKKAIFIKKIGNIHQPDYYFIEVMKSIGIQFIEKTNKISVNPEVEPKLTSNLLIDMREMPDQIITLAFIALVSGLYINITGCETLTYKESDRIAGIIENTKLLGGTAEFKDKTLSITPIKGKPKKCVLKTYDDHRFALTFLVLQKKYKYLDIDSIKCTKKSIIIES